jgi:hypothetical protein
LVGSQMLLVTHTHTTVQSGYSAPALWCVLGIKDVDQDVVAVTFLTCMRGILGSKLILDSHYAQFYHKGPRSLKVYSEKK